MTETCSISESCGFPSAFSSRSKNDVLSWVMMDFHCCGRSNTLTWHHLDITSPLISSYQYISTRPVFSSYISDAPSISFFQPPCVTSGLSLSLTSCITAITAVDQSQALTIHTHFFIFICFKITNSPRFVHLAARHETIYELMFSLAPHPPAPRGSKSEWAANCLICCVYWLSLVCPGRVLMRTQTPLLALCGLLADLTI